MRWVIRVLVAIVLVLAVCVGTLLWMAGGIQRARTFEAPPERVTGAKTRTSTDASTLRIVVWNVAFGYGWGSEGSGTQKPEEHFAQSLSAMGALLAELDADLVLMQEVDFDSKRSHYTDQATALAEKAGFPYVAKAVSWDVNYLPFPYWPPEDHFGRVQSGGAVLSRFPIGQNVVDLYPKPKENGFLYNLGYLFRYLQKVTIEVGDETIPVFNTHLDAFSSQNRQAHAEHIARRLSDEHDPLMLFGGDLNTVPPESTVRSGYPDEPETNHEEDVTLPTLRQVEGLSDALKTDDFVASEKDYFTFPAHAPNRKLDYLFVGDGWEVVELRVVREAGDVSDHLPVFVRLRRAE